MKAERSAYRFGWVDWLILLLVVGAVFVGIYYWRAGKDREQEVRLVTFILCVPIDDAVEWERVILQNSMVMNQNGTMDLGRVTSVEEREALQAVVPRVSTGVGS